MLTGRSTGKTLRTASNTSRGNPFGFRGCRRSRLRASWPRARETDAADNRARHGAGSHRTRAWRIALPPQRKRHERRRARRDRGRPEDSHLLRRGLPRAPPSASREGRICPLPFQGVRVDALRPACASWMAIGMSEYRRTVSTTLPSAFSVLGLILPSGNTAVASMIRSPDPESARLPRWMRCQSVARPRGVKAMAELLAYDE